MVLLNLTEGEAGARVALADESVTGIAFSAEDVGTDDAVTDIGFGAETLYARCISAEDADVVQHRRLLDERRVDVHFGMKGSQRQRLICHAAAVDEQNVAQGVIFRIIFVNDLQWFHFFL